MVIHVRGSDAHESSSLVQHFVERQCGRELRIGKRLLGWSVADTVVIRSAGLSATQLQAYVRHFAPQRHVVFDHVFPVAMTERYFSLARELRNYTFAFLAAPKSESWVSQARLKEQVKSGKCEAVTLTPGRGVAQLEVLLLAAPRVLGSEAPLVLPEPSPRRVERLSATTTQTAA